MRTNDSRVKHPEMKIEPDALQEQYDELEALGEVGSQETDNSKPFLSPTKLAAQSSSLGAIDQSSSAPEASLDASETSSPDPAPAATWVLDVNSRPNEGGSPDVVEFDIFIKHLIGIDFKHEDFTVDAIVMMSWKDERAAKLVPPGLKWVEFPQKDVESKLWLPRLDITNEDFDGISVISTQIKVHEDGTVEKVQRLIARLLNLYDPRLFPFDSQDLRLELASTRYMDDALILRPVKTPAEVLPERFDNCGFVFVSSSITAASDGDPHSKVKKSRGVLSIRVRRQSETYWSVVLVPEMMLVAFSYTVFLLPQVSSFAMPRVATTMITFMSLMALTLKTSTLLPVRGGPTWIDCFEEACTALVWGSSWFNILFMVGIYDLGLEELSASLEKEIIVIFPTIALISGGLLLLAIFYFHFFIWLERVFLIGSLGCHFFSSVYRVYRGHQEKKK